MEFLWLGLLMVTSRIPSAGNEAEAPFMGGGEDFGAIDADEGLSDANCPCVSLRGRSPSFV